MTSLIVRKHWWSILAAASLLAGCASNPAPVVNHSFGGSPPAATAAPQSSPQPAHVFAAGGHANGTVSNGEYTVAPGDTLYSIAFANGMDVRDLAALNGLAAPYVIHPGQMLKLRPGAVGAPTTVVAAAPVVPAVPPAAPIASAPPTATTASGTSTTSAPVFGPVTTQQMTANGVAAAPAPAESTTAAPVVAVQPPVSVPPAPSTAPATASPAAVAPATVAATTPATAPAVASQPTPPPGATREAAGITWEWPASGKIVGGFQPGSGGDGAGLNIAGNMGDPVRAAAAGTVVYSGTGLPGYGALIIVKHNDTYLSAYGHNSKRLVKEGEHVDAGQEIALMGDSGASRVELHFEIRKDGKPVDPLGYLPAR